MRPPRAVESKDNQNGRQKRFNLKNDFLRLTYFKLFSQTERKAINNCDFSLKFVTSVRDGHCGHSPRGTEWHAMPLAPSSGRNTAPSSSGLYAEER
jgi:hypothetical protein